MKKVPLRRCLVSGESYPKHELIRIVRTPEGEIKVDPTGKVNGHGGYLRKDLATLEMAKKSKVLEKKFGPLSIEFYDELARYVK